MRQPEKIYPDRRLQCFIAGERGRELAIEAALLYHLPLFERDNTVRTRISLLLGSAEEADDLMFEYKELFDHSYCRLVRLDGANVSTELRRPYYHGRRREFVDVEWELIIGRLSNPLLQRKLDMWSRDEGRQLIVMLGYADVETSRHYAALLERRLAAGTQIFVEDGSAPDPREEEEILRMAKNLNYCYQKSYETGRIPSELPSVEVEAAWEAIADERMRRSSLMNVRAIPFKMRLLGHKREDWDKFYALTAREIDDLTAVEHNRWSVERLIQGLRPCTDEERREIEADITLKRRYVRERGAHFDLCAFSELGVDETGLPVTRYDRDLTEAIPLIAGTGLASQGNDDESGDADEGVGK